MSSSSVNVRPVRSLKGVVAAPSALNNSPLRGWLKIGDKPKSKKRPRSPSSNESNNDHDDDSDNESNGDNETSSSEQYWSKPPSRPSSRKSNSSARSKNKNETQQNPLPKQTTALNLDFNKTLETQNIGNETVVEDELSNSSSNSDNDFALSNDPTDLTLVQTAPPLPLPIIPPNQDKPQSQANEISRGIKFSTSRGAYRVRIGSQHLFLVNIQDAKRVKAAFKETKLNGVLPLETGEFMSFVVRQGKIVDLGHYQTQIEASEAHDAEVISTRSRATLNIQVEKYHQVKKFARRSRLGLISLGVHLDAIIRSAVAFAALPIQDEEALWGLVFSALPFVNPDSTRNRVRFCGALWCESMATLALSGLKGCLACNVDFKTTSDFVAGVWDLLWFRRESFNEVFSPERTHMSIHKREHYHFEFARTVLRLLCAAAYVEHPNSPFARDYEVFERDGFSCVSTLLEPTLRRTTTLVNQSEMQLLRGRLALVELKFHLDRLSKRKEDRQIIRDLFQKAQTALGAAINASDEVTPRTLLCIASLERLSDQSGVDLSSSVSYLRGQSSSSQYQDIASIGSGSNKFRSRIRNVDMDDEDDDDKGGAGDDESNDGIGGLGHTGSKKSVWTGTGTLRRAVETIRKLQGKGQVNNEENDVASRVVTERGGAAGVAINFYEAVEVAASRGHNRVPAEVGAVLQEMVWGPVANSPLGQRCVNGVWWAALSRNEAEACWAAVMRTLDADSTLASGNAHEALVFLARLVTCPALAPPSTTSSNSQSSTSSSAPKANSDISTGNDSIEMERTPPFSSTESGWRWTAVARRCFETLESVSEVNCPRSGFEPDVQQNERRRAVVAVWNVLVVALQRCKLLEAIGEVQLAWNKDHGTYQSLRFFDGNQMSLLCFSEGAPGLDFTSFAAQVSRKRFKQESFREASRGPHQVWFSSVSPKRLDAEILPLRICAAHLLQVPEFKDVYEVERFIWRGLDATELRGHFKDVVNYASKKVLCL